MKRFLNILRYVFWLLVIIPPMLFWAMVIGYVFDEVGDCAENGKVWDYKELCKKYNAPLNLKYGYCDFGFEVKDCFKLEGEWEYPEICYQ